jgi:pectate lyase-like protein
MNDTPEVQTSAPQTPEEVIDQRPLVAPVPGNVTDYGATGDGVRDDAPAVQAAVDHAATLDPASPLHPDFEWPGGQGVASKDDVGTAIAHMKAWFKREFGKSDA